MQCDEQTTGLCTSSIQDLETTDCFAKLQPPCTIKEREGGLIRSEKADLIRKRGHNRKRGHIRKREGAPYKEGGLEGKKAHLIRKTDLKLLESERKIVMCQAPVRARQDPLTS